MYGGSFRDDFRNAWNKPNNAVAQIIIINVVIFIALLLLDIFLPDKIFDQIHKQFVIPPLISEFVCRPYTILTYAFTHNLRGILHIAFNLLIFYWFGKLIAEYLGSDKVISIYVMGAISGALLYLFAYNLVPEYRTIAINTLAEDPTWGMVGASGAIYAIVVAAAVKLPNYTFYLLFFGPVRIKYIAVFVVLLSLVGINANNNIGGNIAHLGGVFMGWLFIVQLNKGYNLGGWVISSITFIKSLFKPSPKIKVTHRSRPKQTTRKSSKKTAKSGRTEGTSQEEIDAILDKISQKGYESLSKEEKQKLFNASK